MFTGITQGLFEVSEVLKKPGFMSYTVKLSPNLISNLKLGASVAVDGVCQTVVQINNDFVRFEAIKETLEKTTLNQLASGNKVSIERSLRLGDEIGGHEVSGHVFGTAVIKERIEDDSNLTLIIACDPQWMKYILPKGFIAIDGSSLTVGQTIPESGLFYIHLIPETLRLTHFAYKTVGDKINVELDQKTKTIVDTVIRTLTSKDLYSALQCL